MKTYAIETVKGTRYVSASTRANAVRKLTGLTEASALHLNQIKSVRLCK
jgi:hypothetical protein